MLSSAIVIFREVFEIVLIVGIILAATRTMPHRLKAIALGFAGGIGGSVLVALFTDHISNLAEGVGQELFNACILFTAALFIGWTVLWMKRHAKDIKGKFTQLGQDVAEGRAQYFSLSLVITLATLREGSEIVLFSYGMLAAGMSPVMLAGGAAIGLAGGLITGIMLYKGLLKLSMKHFFAVTSWLLVLLVAGMMSQGAGFLVAAGYFDNLSRTVWDSSWLISDRGFVGQGLGMLIGYTARPAAIQVIFFLSTLTGLLGLMKITEKGITLRSLFKPRRTTTAVIALLSGIAALLAAPQTAEATKKVYAPYVEQGEIEAEWRGGYTIDDDNDEDGAWVQKFALGYGVTERWFTELYTEFEREGESGADTEFAEIEWENRFQLTEPGEYWLDAGLYGAYAINTTGGPDKVEAKLLLAKDVGQFTHLANLIAERQVGEDASNDMEYGLAWSSRYRYSPEFEPGFEIHSGFEDLGENDFDEDDHRVGPVAYGALGPFKYDAGVLFGVSDAAPDATLKVILEYEWRF